MTEVRNVEASGQTGIAGLRKERQSGPIGKGTLNLSERMPETNAKRVSG